MRIVIDMQGMQTGSRFRGIGRYTMAFAQCVVKNRGEHEIILALSGLFPDTIEHIRAVFNGLLPQDNIRVWHAPGPVKEGQPGNESRREVAELLREAFLTSLHPDIIHVSSHFEGYGDDAVTSIGRFDTKTPVSVTLHDLIPLLNPEQYLKHDPLLEKYYYRKIESLKRAAVYLAISESSLREGIELLFLPEELVVNASEDTDDQFRPVDIPLEEEQVLKQKYRLSRHFVLYTGATDERKNLPRLIQAYADLPTRLRNSYQLVFAGGMPEGHAAHLRRIAHKAGLNTDELIFTGYVTDLELVYLYNLCRLFVFPSWHEGFGLPALEAMRCGVPVIGANTSSLPEVIGLDDALFDPFDVKSITAKMVQVLQDETFSNRLRIHGLKQAKKFSWDETARLAIGAWESRLDLIKGSKESLRLIEAKSEDMYQQLIGSISAIISENHVGTEQYLRRIALCIAESFPPPQRQRQLLVDVSELVKRDAKSGIQRVVRSILREWLGNPPEGFRVELVYATESSPGYQYARRFTCHFLQMTGDGIQDEPAEAWPGDIFVGLDLQPSVVPCQQSVLQKWHKCGVKVWFVVYDLLPILIPRVFPSGSRIQHQRWLESISQYDGVACISHAVADEMREWLATHGSQRERPLQIEWFRLGGDVDLGIQTCGLPTDEPNVLDALNSSPSFLMVGTVEPRKGHAQTLGAFEHLWKSGMNVNLVIVGKQGWMVEALIERMRSHPQSGKHLFWLDGISDEYLEKIYSAASCLIAASEAEGFGLPLIEAARHKLPIMARDIPVFHEIAGEHAYYFSGVNAMDMADAIKTWLELAQNGKAPLSSDMPWLTWKESAQSLMKTLLDMDTTY